MSEGQLVTCRLSIPHVHTNLYKRSTLYFYVHMHSLTAPSSLPTPPPVQTFFSEGASQQKELAVLRELCEGHFNHDNLCRVLHVSLDRAPVLSWKGALLGAISGRDDLGSCVVKKPFSSSFPSPSSPSSPPSSLPSSQERFNLTLSMWCLNTAVAPISSTF